MSPASILLRCLLCLGLIVNGLGSAVAGVRMLELKANTALEAAAASPDVAMTMPCHDEGMAASSDAEPAVAVQEQGGRDAGCCHSSICYCDCLHSVQADISVPLLVAARPPQRESVQLTHESYMPPSLSLLLRPPIALRS